MQKQLTWLLFAAFALTALSACKKNTEENDTNPPVISITSPAENAAIAGAVSITGKVTDESLHELTIKVTRDADNVELYTQAPTVHDLTEYDIAYSWTPAGISAETAVTLTVTAEDHSSHVVTQTVKFTVKP